MQTGGAAGRHLRQRPPIVFILALAALVAGCAGSGTWQNPAVPEAEWSNDQSACQSWARREAERDYALQEMSRGPMNYDLGGQWASDMNRYSAGRRQKQLFERCMTQRGYRFVPDPE